MLRIHYEPDHTALRDSFQMLYKSFVNLVMPNEPDFRPVCPANAAHPVVVRKKVP